MTRHLTLMTMLLCIPLLAACQDMGEGARMTTDHAKQSLIDTKEAVENLLYYKPKAEEYKPIPYTFCYQVMQDINCYNQPMAEARGRLVGWQGRGTFNIEDPQSLPAKTALVRQPRAIDARNPIKQAVEITKKKEEPELVSLEPVFIPEAPKVKQEKIVTIKATAPASDALY